MNYYDGYDFLSNFTAHSDSLAYREMNGYDSRYQSAGDAMAARGMLTGTATRVLNTSGNGGLLVRAVINQNGTLEEVNGYYPYGGITGAPATGVQLNKYGGKELDRENGLDWYDFEARMYDSMLPQFNSIDRKAEDYPGTSPFAYCAGNPIRYIDPNGEKIIISFDPRDEKHGNNDSQRFMAKEYPDDDAIHIFSHGYKNGISVFHNGKRVIISNPKELDAFLTERSAEWKTRNNNEKMTIILHSCETGQGDNSFAERVSKDLKNTVVIAPDEKVVVNKENRLYGVYQTHEEYEGENILTKPVKLGHWKVFEDGKVIATYMGIWKPKSKITFFDYIYKLKQ